MNSKDEIDKVYAHLSPRADKLHTDTRLKYLAEYQLSLTQNGFPCPGWGDPYVFFCQGALCTTFWAARCAGRYLAGVRLASVPANSEVVFPQTGCGNRGKLLRKEQQGGDFSTSSRQVVKIKALEAFQAAADGKATKIIIPSEIQGLAGLASSGQSGSRWRSWDAPRRKRTAWGR